jgi:hypothetical protein
VIDDRTEYDVLPHGARAKVVCRRLVRDAMARRHPGRPTCTACWSLTLRREFACPAGGPAAALGITPFLEHGWPAVKALTKKLSFDGQVEHADACAALGLTDEGGPGSGALA